MLERILMPRLDQGMEEGTVIEWLVEVGTEVTEGQPLVEIETEKVSTEIESTVSGAVLRVDHGAGEQVAVGTVIGWLGDGTEEPPALDGGGVAGGEPQPVAGAPEPGTAAPSAADPSTAGTSAPASAPQAAAPAVLGVVAPAPVEPLPVDRSAWQRPHVSSPRQREGSAGAGQAVARSDVGVRPLDRQRQAVVATVNRSWQAPQFRLEADVDATRIVGLLDAWRSLGREPRLTLTDLILAAIAVGVEAEPSVNAWFEQDYISWFGPVDVTLLAQVEDRLLMPVVADVGRRDLAGVAGERARVVGLAREGRLGAAELRTGSISLSNLSSSRVDRFTALLIPPQVAVIAVGRIRPVAGIPTVTLTVTFDHRAVDGVAGSRFLGAVATALEEPLLLTT